MRTLLAHLEVRVDVANGATSSRIDAEPKMGVTATEELGRGQLANPVQEEYVWGAGDPVVDWAMRHAAWLLTMFHKAAMDGVTAHERLTGKPYSGSVLPFACPVLWLDEREAGKKDAGPRWRTGLWVGIMTGNPKNVALTAEGTATTSRTVRAMGNESFIATNTGN